MARLFYHVMQDNAGNLLFDVSGTMRLAGSGTLATIYGDEALTVILPNPMTNHPSFGSFKCFLASGDFDFYMAKSGYTFETLTGVQGLGTMAQQDASAVAITGGTAQGLSSLSTAPGATAGATIGIQTPPVGNNALRILHRKELDQFGILMLATIDVSHRALALFNSLGTEVGSITYTGSATAYNTASDVRLKHAIAPLTGALDVVRALNPITHRWRADESPGVGFAAHEVQEVIPDGVITGQPDAVDNEGNILPQMIDMSKLVPYLTAGLKDAIALIDTLAARVASLEMQLGV